MVGAAVLLLANTIRLGVVDHLWALAIGIDVVAIAAIPLVASGLHRRDRNQLAHQPGALFVAGGSVLRSQLEQQGRFRPAVRAMRHSWIGGGYLGGELEITHEAISFRPGRWMGFGARDVSVPWAEVEAVDITPVPAKVNVGMLDMQLNDGSRLDVEVRGYETLRKVLADLRR